MVSVPQKEGEGEVKIIVIGRGTPTSRQIQLLAKALRTDPSKIKVAKVIEQINSPKEVTEALQQTGAKVVLSFVAHPTVISALQTARRFVEFDYYVPRTEAVTTKTVNSMEEAKKLCQETNADIVNTKMLDGGQVSVRCTKTVSLMKNPVIIVQSEEEISD